MKRANLFLKYTQKIYYIIEFYKYKCREYYYNELLSSCIDNNYYSLLSNSSEITILQTMQHIFIDMINALNDEMYEYNTIQKKTFKFLIVAFTDELVIQEIIENHISEWNNLLLEKYFFNTSIAGEKIIKNIIEHNQYHANNNNEMSIIYYYIVFCGFEGINKNNTNELNRIKLSIFKVLSNDFNIKNYALEQIDNNSYEILKGPNISNVINYKNVYTNIFILIITIELIYIFYMFYYNICIKL